MFFRLRGGFLVLLLGEKLGELRIVSTWFLSRFSEEAGSPQHCLAGGLPAGLLWLLHLLDANTAHTLSSQVRLEIVS
jgi:hypothetical protein